MQLFFDLYANKYYFFLKMFRLLSKSIIFSVHLERSRAIFLMTAFQIYHFWGPVGKKSCNKSSFSAWEDLHRAGARNKIKNLFKEI